MLSRKYYKMIAQCIKDSSVEVVDETTQDGNSTMYLDKDVFMWDLSRALKKDNSLFNRSTFYEACD